MKLYVQPTIVIMSTKIDESVEAILIPDSGEDNQEDSKFALGSLIHFTNQRKHWARV